MCDSDQELANWMSVFSETTYRQLQPTGQGFFDVQSIGEGNIITQNQEEFTVGAPSSELGLLEVLFYGVEGCPADNGKPISNVEGLGAERQTNSVVEDDCSSSMPNWPGYGTEIPLNSSHCDDNCELLSADHEVSNFSRCNLEMDRLSVPRVTGQSGSGRSEPKIYNVSDISDSVLVIQSDAFVKEAPQQRIQIHPTLETEEFEDSSSNASRFSIHNCLKVINDSKSEDQMEPKCDDSISDQITSTTTSSPKTYLPKSSYLLFPLQTISELKLYCDTLSALLAFKGASSRLAISSCMLLGRVIGRVMDHPYVSSVGGCISETAIFVADRTQDLSDHYLTSIISDDPEHLHIQRLLQAREAVWGWVHQHSCFLSSLPWHQRQLLRETRDLDRHIEMATSLSTLRSSDCNGTKLEENIACEDVKASEELGGDGNNNSSIRGGIAVLQHWLQGAAEDGDEEAQYALSRWFTRPTFQEGSQCTKCSRPFSVSMFRHHCRCCGLSYCSIHSTQRRSLLRLGVGLISPVRVCDKCASEVDQEVLLDTLTWRKMRVEAYLANFSREIRGINEDNENGISTSASISDGCEGGGVLIPYDDKCVDRNVDKIIRVADYSLQVIKSTVSLNYPTKLALHTVDILKRYGLSGLAGVLLRKDFMEAVETLKRISGIDRMFSLSLHELTACIYYKLAIDRGLRGCDPEGESSAHRTAHTAPDESALLDFEAESADTNVRGGAADISSGASAAAAAAKGTDSSHGGCEEVEEAELDNTIRFAPLALSAVYEESPADMQRLALAQGWSTIFICSQSAPEQPAYTLFATAAKGEKKEVVLAVRGTASVEDIVTDIRAAPQRFPPSEEDIAKALAQPLSTSPYCRTSNAAAEQCQGSQKDDEWLLINSDKDIDSTGEGDEDESYACGGMARAALWLLGQVGPSLLQLLKEGYNVILVGHSMGGAVAALLCHLLRVHLQATIQQSDTSKANILSNDTPSFRCITYGCPSSMCIKLAESMQGYTTSVVLHDDIVSRITPQSIRLLMRELMVFRQQVFRHLRQDWSDVISRARDLWSPKNRTKDGQTAQSVSTANINASTASAFTTVCASDSAAADGGDGRAWSSRNHSASTECKSSLPCPSNSGPASFPIPALNDDVDDVPVVVEDEDRDEWVPSLWLPGRVLHIYSHHGRYKIVKAPRDLPTLRRIEVQGNIFTDHVGQTIFDSLLEVRAVRASDYSLCMRSSSSGGARSGFQDPCPPVWTPYDGSVLCACCDCPFTWHSTFQGEAQEYRERYNCRHCGGLVCGPCSTKRRSIPRLGLIQPSRVCDKCFHKASQSVS